MKKLPLTIVIPALNEERFLPTLLESLANQSVKDFEVIVVDGKSTDKTVEKAKAFTRRLPSLTVVVADHANLPYQRNFGAKRGRGEWFVFLDSDNVMMPYAVERMVTFIQKEKPEFFSCWMRPDSDIMQDAIFALFTDVVLEGSILINRPFSPGPFTAVRRDVFEKVKGYTSGLKWGEDVDFSTKVKKAGYKLSILREVLYIWSMRRLRNEGKLKFIQQSAKAALFWLLTNKAFTKGYEMGGQLYAPKKTNGKKTKNARLLKISKSFKVFLREVFA